MQQYFVSYTYDANDDRKGFGDLTYTSNQLRVTPGLLISFRSKAIATLRNQGMDNPRVVLLNIIPLSGD